MTTQVKPNVLVVEAHAIGMIGVIRSLGRAGYYVHAAAQMQGALGLLSRFAGTTVVHPRYRDARFLPWLREYLLQHDISCIIPSEGFLMAIRAEFEEFRRLIPDAPEAKTLYRCFSKSEVEVAFSTQGDAAMQNSVPKATVLRCSDDIPSIGALESWNWPIWLKTDARFAKDRETGYVRRIANQDELCHSANKALSSHRQCLLQEFVPGVKATVNLWRHKGKIRARSMCIAMHETPHTGGLTAYRKFWWHDEMCRDAEKRLELLNWEGVAMVEYRWQASSQRFWFLELNARYWNALNMDLLAGKDFPRWQVDAFFSDESIEDLSPGPLGFAARYTVPADAGYLMSLLRDPAVSFTRKFRGLLEWCWLAVNPKVKSDLWFKGDRRLYLRAWRRFYDQLTQ